MPVVLTKRYTTLRELEEWQAYFAMRMEKNDKDDWRFASVADAIYKVMGGAKTKIADHLLVFKDPDAQQNEPLEMHQARWFAAVGFVPE